MKIGDVFIKGGSPGHAVIIVDMAENDKVPFGVRLGEYLEREADPRLSEIVNRLHAISLPFSE